MKIYNNDGTVYLDEQIINDYDREQHTHSIQREVAECYLDDGKFVLVWQSKHQYPDENSYDIYAKIYYNNGTVF